MSFFRALGPGYLYVRASAVKAKGNSRLKTENGLLGRRDRAKWNRSKVTPLSKWPYGRRLLCRLGFPAFGARLQGRALGQPSLRGEKNTILRRVVTSGARKFTLMGSRMGGEAAVYVGTWFGSLIPLGASSGMCEFPIPESSLIMVWSLFSANVEEASVLVIS